MTTAVRRRRGTTAQHATFTGLEGEISIDTTKDTVVVHDGTTAGGHPLAKENNTALTGNVTVTTNSSSTALTITQDGTGNALEVRDVTGDTTPFVVDANGRVGVGTAPLYTIDGISVSSSASFAPQMFTRSTANDGAAAYYNFEKSRSGTVVQSGDDLGSIVWRGYDGSSYVNAAWVTVEVDGTPGTNDMPGRLVFSTTADGASSPTERMRIDSSGNVGIGGTPTQKLHIHGSSGADVYARITNTDSGVNAGLLVGMNGNEEGVIRVETNQALILGTNNTERMRIDSSGNVRVGVTAASVANENMTVNGFAIVGDRTSTNPAVMIGNTGSGSGVIGTFSNHSVEIRTNNTERMRIDSAGLITANNSTGLGYGTGSGGTVTQATSKSTAVTLNKPCGQITMHNAALAAGAEVLFAVTNSTVSAADVVVCHVGVTLGYQYTVRVVETYTGGFSLGVKNITGGSLSDALVLNFTAIKGSLS